MRFATDGGRLISSGGLFAALALPFAALAVVRLLPPLPLDTDADGGWLAALGAATVAVTAAASALAWLVSGLRSGRAGAIVAAGGGAALAGGFAAQALGVEVGQPAVAASALLWLSGAAAERAELVIDPAARRAVVAGVAFAGIEALLIGLLLAGSLLAPLAFPLLALGTVAYGAIPLVVPGRWPPAGSLLLAAGAAVWALSRPASLDLLLAEATLAAGAIIMAAASAQDAASGESPARPTAEPPAEVTDLLPELARRLAEGVLLFDARGRLRDWNAGATELLRLAPGSSGTRLRELLGEAIAEVEPARDWTVLHPPRTREPVEVALLPYGVRRLVLLRDPAGPPAIRERTERLERELRGTIEELMQARRTVELQREELEHAATVDPLTGVASRGAILERLRVEVAEARRYAHPLAMLLVDVDGMALLNHLHGLEVGDVVLRELALRIRLRVRQADALGRSASDAFLAILPHTDEEGAVTFADALRGRVAQRPVATPAGLLPVAVSIGVAILRPGEQLDVDAVLTRVEEALGSAQAAGGDRIALDRLHGLARLEPRRRGVQGAQPEPDAHRLGDETAQDSV